MHTPLTLKEKFENDLKRLNNFETVIEVTGVYCDKGRKSYPNKKHGSVYYDRLKDCKTEDSLTILVPENFKVLLSDGKIYKLRCLTEYKTSGECGADLQLGVLEIVGSEADNPRERELLSRKSEILRKFYDRKPENVSLLLKEIIKKSERPRITLILGRTAETLNDIRGGLGEHRDRYAFIEYPVNIRNEREIIAALREIAGKKDTDLIVLFRGGGSLEDLSVFDSAPLAETVIDLPVPLVTAIGHADDEPFVQRVSHRSFITPTDFGNYLRETYVNSGREDDLSERENVIVLQQSTLETKQQQLHALELSLSRKAAQTERQEGVLPEENKRSRDGQELSFELERYRLQNKLLIGDVAGVAILLVILAGLFAAYLLAR